MAKVKKVFFCSDCGNEAAQWSGQCGSCGSWNTMTEAPTQTMHPAGRLSVVTSPAKAVNMPISLTEAVTDPAVLLPTGMAEMDRVLSGGLVRGSVTLLGGEPGIGKSTIVLQLCAAVANQGGRCLIVTGEESAEQVGRRAVRLKANVDGVMVQAQSDVEGIIGVLNEMRPELLVIDSIQTMTLASVGSAAGSVSQVRESAQVFTAYAKQNNVATLIIGHVTKDGSLAGPRVLEHLVDTVLEFEGDRHHGLRFLRTVKHRFGSTDEVGVLQMTESGLQSVLDVSEMFLDDRRSNVSGSVVAPVLTGRRPMLVEIQGLVNESSVPRRYAQGLDGARLATVLGVLAKHSKYRLSDKDVYASVVGGIRIDEPAVDLPMALAVASSSGDLHAPSDLVVIGEVGLGGEVRKVAQIGRRLNEAKRMGFSRALVPKGSSDDVDGIEAIQIETVAQALSYLKRK